MASPEVRLSLLGSVFNHLVLPPKIPGSQDDDVDAVSQEVLRRLIRATGTAINLTAPSPWREQYEDLRDCLQACLELNRGHLEQGSLLRSFQNLDQGKAIILYLNEQNACLLIRLDKSGDEDCVIFESFEASAASCAVLAAGHAMQWDFPGRSAHISVAQFSEESFQESLATFLEQASMESLYTLEASTRKAGVSVGEIRDTTDPALITQMLMSLLEAVGGHYQAPILRKRIRDDVNFTSGQIPWRRLPFWLILRVATQRQLCFALGAERGQLGYKFLMAILLAELLGDSAGSLDPHNVVCLRTKLARRMAKLEVNQEKIRLDQDAACNSWFAAASAVVRNSIETANEKVEAAWEAFKNETTRRITLLPTKAPPYSQFLSLPNSGGYLDSILSTSLSPASALGPVALPSPLDQSIQRTQQFMDSAFELASLEQRIEQDASQQPNAQQAPELRCLQLRSQIEYVFEAVGSTYNSNPEQNSAMILAVFTLWVELDKAAVAECSLLADHAPVFPPELLDALQLPARWAMERLQRIQEYLASRHAASIYGNILENQGQDSFALRYLAKSQSLQSLEKHIQECSDHARDKKIIEHERLCGEYDKHTEGIAQNQCLCTWDGTQRIVRGCKRCWHWRMRQRIKIWIHEALLPKKNPARGIVVFELGLPSWLSAYRDVTWHILSSLAHPYRPKSEPPEIQLQDCRPLKIFMEANVNRLSLASTKKCFEKTHYKFNQGRAPLNRVLLPFAAEFKLYDSKLKIWVDDLTNPLTLEHLCGIQIPGSLLTILPNKLHPPTIMDGPSSYEIQANQAVVPSDVSVQAFSAYQKLLAGKRRRWPNLLVEMSSSNLNLSDENTTRVICQLASQAGPRLPDEPLRAVHEVFKLPVFTNRLISVLKGMLESIRGNWREHNIMQLVINLALRLCYLSAESLGATILATARKYLLGWISELRQSVHKTNDSAAVQHYATYGLYAALLCRETFAILATSDDPLNQADLSAWMQASIAMQENILHDLNNLSDTLRSLLLRDAKMVYHLQNHIKRAMGAYRSVVGTEILRSWSGRRSDVENASASWTFLPTPHDRWIVATTPGPFAERLHFHYIEGHLLVNGKPRSKLPLDIANDEDVKRIFGDQHLLTFRSREPGMSHRLTHEVEGHQVHFGLQDQRVIIRATRYSSQFRKPEILEFVPQRRLKTPSSFDLPDELVLNCGHWLNINTRCLEIRRGVPGTSAFWKKRLRDWVLDVPGRIATRENSRLIDPGSEIFAHVADIFRDFEAPNKLTVFQPQSFAGRLTVELKHLDLRFFVNDENLLQCQQLNAEVDPNQDPGTWYGLRSKIVMREIRTQSRSIIVPLGELNVRRDGLHVDVRILGNSDYARFKIDSILGRLSCSPEPRLIYTKALYHAITSFCIPDPLTGRNGSSEAFDILQSGAAQPWISITRKGNQIFENFNKLVPRREYYPPNLKRIQRVLWDPDLTLSIQCDGYRPLIEAIKERSNKLGVFTSEPGFELIGTDYLCCRGRAQRQIYDPLLDTEAGEGHADAIYHPRDRQNGAEASQVYQITRAILSRCSQFYMSRTLKSILESSETIGGFSGLDHRASTSFAGPLIRQIEDPITENWGELVNFCRHRANTASLIFRLGLLAFHSKADMDAVHSLAAFCIVDEIKNLDPPQYQFFANFESRDLPPVELLEELMASTYPKFRPITNSRGKKRSIDANNRSETEHEQACKKEGIELARRIQKLWPMPADDITIEMLSQSTDESLRGRSEALIDISSAWNKIKPEWQRLFANVELNNYIMRIDEVLGSLCRTRDAPTPVLWVTTKPVFMISQRFLSCQSIVQDWTAKRGPTLSTVGSNLLHVVGTRANSAAHPHSIPNHPAELNELDGILQEFEQSDNNLRKQYAGDLRESLTAFQTTVQRLEPETTASVPGTAVVNRALRYAWDRVRKTWVAISAALTAHDNRTPWLQLGAMQPITTPIELLILLRSKTSLCFGLGMKEAIVSYGCALTEVQHLVRIQRALWRKDDQALHGELRYMGHENWEPIQVPDWLLLEIDSNILIRPEQEAVARAIIDPNLGNGVLQLSMGKGKTSCIIPMAEAVLADGQNLSRHLLSYKLFGWQKFVDSKQDTADQMIKFQKWLDTYCRDVLDECDFTLSVKTQLNYPSGPEMPVDFHPYRWQIAQELLGLVANHLRDLQCRGIQVTSRRKAGYFPAIQFLRTDAEDAVHNLIIKHISLGGLTSLRPAGHHIQRSTIREVLCEKRISHKALNRAARLFTNPNIAVNALLLVRGLLLHRIIVTCLGKRWNVQYGLHPDRHPIAVPYEAKGKPSEQAEYGHPDVAILFTCLSFYYAGLTQGQVVQGVQHILHSNDPAAQYEWWTSTCPELPTSLRDWNVINSDDKGQMEELWNFLRRNRVVINHYLNHFVFPVHARQFEVKLQACSWDIPICLEENTQGTRTTGFSGTNDNRLMLPLTISQRDLPELRHTSAEVLSYLLQRRNRDFHVIADPQGRRLTEKELLRDLKYRGISVLIDVGAYISEMQNEELAQAWLEVDPDAKAAVYFGKDNRAWVHYKSNAKEDVPLLATPFAEDLSGCNVFLDEGHTRGVDLVLPTDAYGAVTLALNLTKDHTVQAAMRLRQLRTTQRIAFYGPPEVEQSIRDFRQLDPQKGIDSSYVVSWLLEQTCRSVEDLQGLYVAQGIDFCRRADAIWHCGEFVMKQSERQKLLEVLKQPERKTLKELYGPSSEGSSISLTNNLTSSLLRSFMDRLALTSKDQQDGIQTGALEEVEQERQVEAQIEQVRQVQKRKKYAALKFPGIHLEILHFAQTGKLESLRSTQTRKPGFKHAFAFVSETTIGKRFGVHETNSKLFVSSEFSNSVKVPPDSEEGNNFLRPVEWLVWSPKTETALVVIPEEAECLIELLRGKGSKSRVHLIAYAAPVTKAMVPFNRLEFYSFPELPKGQVIPDRIKIELGILAGRLYVEKREWKVVEEYVRGSGTGTAGDSDKMALDLPTFILEWLGVRRKSVDLLHTHMGYICTGRSMEELGSSEDENED
ncbi:hypothetical protein O1611_g4237 [Lasiodiplodia mahajangana]|uniref:Uncharacterized protein n=1 Tax=Lasiodiplodia mahajangana TaxID=1108764 RepID=A0ACC2JPH6_9PEZI|nr:hypothetical protein O1611_g4237 [Lasiodiplodia mahajangana]